jgi:hypothetical protein
MKLIATLAILFVVSPARAAEELTGGTFDKVTKSGAYLELEN